jgi:hypothetical protein
MRQESEEEMATHDDLPREVLPIPDRKPASLSDWSPIARSIDKLAMACQ